MDAKIHSHKGKFAFFLIMILVVLFIILHTMLHIKTQHIRAKHMPFNHKGLDKREFLRQMISRKPHWCRYLIDEVYLIQFLQVKLGLELELRPFRMYNGVKNSSPCNTNALILKSGQNMTLILERHREVHDYNMQLHDVVGKKYNQAIHKLCTYNVSTVSSPDSNHPNTVILKITETPNPNITGPKILKQVAQVQCRAGASFFKAHVSGAKSKSFCNLHSDFDGTYHVVCPVYESNSAILIHRMSLNFDNFFRLGHRQGVFVYRGKLPNPHGQFEDLTRKGNKECALRSNHSISNIVNDINDGSFKGNHGMNSVSNTRHAYLAKAFAFSRGLWMKGNSGQELMKLMGERWDYFIKGCPVRKVTKFQYKQCLQHKIDRLIIIGDSHMRYWSFYMMVKLNWIDPRMPKYYPQFEAADFLQNIVRIGATYMSKFAQYAETLIDDLQRINITLTGTTEKPDIIVGDSCHWDLAFGDTVTFVINFERALSALEKLLKERQGRLKVMWAGMVASTDFAETQSQTIMAYNGWMYNRLAEIGVEIFDSFSILYPFNDQRAAGGHYIYVIPEKNYVRATVGISYIELLTAFICK